jgi:hypothetical protein
MVYFENRFGDQIEPKWDFVLVIRPNVTERIESTDWACG